MLDIMNFHAAVKLDFNRFNDSRFIIPEVAAKSHYSDRKKSFISNANRR